jgi:AcrR family transcriptional regulator
MPRIIENPKQLILDTARSILLDKGYSELSMRNVAKECGIAIGTIYNYYPTKKDLIIDMMSGYWAEYINILEKTIDEDNTFFVKLHDIFKELKAFVNTFKEVWLRPELYDTPDYVENGLAKQSIYMEKLIRSMENLLLSESAKPDSVITLKLDSYETAKFILLNFITIIQMPSFEYQSFEAFLKELMQ